MAKTFRLTIATPAGWAADDEAESLTVPGVEGYLGILADHAPLMTALGVGLLQYRDSAGYEHVFAVTDGFLEVANNKVTIIADAAEANDCIDIDRANDALKRAQARLDMAATDPSVDLERARASYRRALNRIKAAKTCDIFPPPPSDKKN